MPDSQGNFVGIAVPADAWERIFGCALDEMIADYTAEDPTFPTLLAEAEPE